MKPIRIFFGLIIIFLGFIFLAINVKAIDFSNLNNFVIFWPVLIILFGLAMIIKNSLLYFLLSILTLLVVSYLAFADPFSWQKKEVAQQNEDTKPNIVAVYDKPIDTFKFTLDLGAAVINVNNLDDSNLNTLLRGNYSGINNLEETRTNQDNVANLQIKEKSLDQNTILSPNKKRFMNLNISDRIATEFNINSGASKIDMDFSNVILKKLNISSGASSIKVKLGDKADSLDAVINSGVSDINILVPKDFGIKIDSGSILLGRNFTDLDLKQDKNTYTSKDFDSKTKKLNIKLSSGVSKLTVTQY